MEELGEGAKYLECTVPAHTHDNRQLHYNLTPFNASYRHRHRKRHPNTIALEHTYCFPFLLFTPHPCVYKRGRRETVLWVGRLTPTHHTHVAQATLTGTWALAPFPDQFVTPTTNFPGIRTLSLETGRRVLLLGGPNQYKLSCLLC
jgi:hypothetical protein